MTEELKPVRCGCGGEADAHMLSHRGIECYYIRCEECGTKTAVHTTLTEAVTAWNRAMGKRKYDVGVAKGYWMAKYDGLRCSVCNYKCETTALPSICPHCGARLEWE